MPTARLLAFVRGLGTSAVMAPAFMFAACGGDPALELDEGVEAQPIIHGEACEPGELDTAVAILLDADVTFFGQSSNMKTVTCTGTLIAPDVVLTAAHCLDSSSLTFGFGEVTREEYFVTFESDLSGLVEQEQGAAAPAFPADSTKAKKTVVHENFSLQDANQTPGPGNYRDIGLLFLERAIDAVEPEVVITAAEATQLEVGANVLIAGWGQQTPTQGPFDPPPPGTVGKKMCATSFVGELGSHEMQIGGDSTTSRKCHGDSGGPSYLEVTTEHTRTRRVVGITSHAYDQEDCNKGGVDTRVDAWLDWFDAQMRAACMDGTRVWCEVEGLIPPSYYDPPPPSMDAGDGKDDDDDKPADGCQCGESESGDPMAAFALVALGGFVLRRRRR